LIYSDSKIAFLVSQEFCRCRCCNDISEISVSSNWCHAVLLLWCIPRL